MKKIISVLMTIIIMSGMFITAYAEESYGNEVSVETAVMDYSQFSGTGDVNSDRIISAADARLILRHSAKITLIDDFKLYAADIDKNGIITAADARTVLRVSAKLEELILSVIELGVGEKYIIKNMKNAGSGSYNWQYKLSDDSAFEMAQSIAPPENVELKPGTPYNQTFYFKTLKAGEYKVHFELICPWTKDISETADFVFIVK